MNSISNHQVIGRLFNNTINKDINMLKFKHLNLQIKNEFIMASVSASQPKSFS